MGPCSWCACGSRPREFAFGAFGRWGRLGAQKRRPPEPSHPAVSVGISSSRIIGGGLFYNRLIYSAAELAGAALASPRRASSVAASSTARLIYSAAELAVLAGVRGGVSSGTHLDRDRGKQAATDRVGQRREETDRDRQRPHKDDHRTNMR